MAKETEVIVEKEQPAVEQPATEQPPQLSAKDRYRSRYGESYPDMNLDDEEAFYTQANSNLDELENYRQSNKELGEAFDRTPELAGMVVAARNGQNPFAWLAENIGPDMDIRELANNPEFAESMGNALTKFMENQEKAKAKKEEIGNNAIKSIETLKELQAEKGLSDEQCIKMANDFFGEFDEDGNPVGKESFMYKASNGIVTKGMWESLINGRNYDADIKSATDKARASALNEKVQNGIKNFQGTGLPQSMSTSGAGKTPEKKKNNNSFADFGM